MSHIIRFFTKIFFLKKKERKKEKEKKRKWETETFASADESWNRWGKRKRWVGT